jgi:lysophospholipase L1-like esterase
LVKKLTRIAFALALSVVAADVCGSLFLVRDGIFLGRPLPPFGALTYPEQQLDTLQRMAADLRGTARFDPELGWTWRPSSQEEKYRIDALGARGPREYGPAPAPGKRRVVTFGDSFTFGDEIAVDATFQVLLEGFDRSLEVLNFGVSGYGTDQALLRYRRIGRGLGADVACLGILLENIGRNVNRYRPLWNAKTGFCVTKPRFVLDEHGELVLVPQPFATREDLHAAILDGSVVEHIAEHEYWIGRPHVPTGKLSSLVRIASGYLAYRERTPALLWRDVEGEPFRVTLAILERFHREALEDGARLAPILVFPSKEDLREYALPGRPYWNGLFAELDRRGVPYLDLITPLAARARELGEEPPAKSLFQGGHLSKVGNAIVATELQAWIKARSR